MNNNSTVVEILSALKKHGVEYMIVVGMAVGYYGYLRPSMAINGQYVDEPDLDIWYNPSIGNYFHLLNALEQLKIDVTRHRKEQIIDPKTSFFKFKLEDGTFDILPNLKAPLKFRESYEKRNILTRNGLDISFISLGDLIADKQATGRLKDLSDIENLKRINPHTIL